MNLFDIAVGGLLLASIFVFVLASEGIAVFFQKFCSEETAGILSRTLLISLGLAWYLLCRKIRKK